LHHFPLGLIFSQFLLAFLKIKSSYFVGHGRDVGKNAAMAGKEFLMKYLDENYANMISDPVAFFSAAFQFCHNFIREAFRSALTANGWEVMLSPENYLLKRKTSSQPWLCVHGGSSCSIVAMVGTKLYTANVGDSTGIICSKFPLFSNSDLVHLSDSAEPPAPRSICAVGTTSLDTLVITAEHSPEYPEEFLRLRLHKHRQGDETQPSLNVVYDAQGHDKNSCSPVFRIEADGKPIVTNNGKYYKNVRKEW